MDGSATAWTNAPKSRGISPTLHRFWYHTSAMKMAPSTPISKTEPLYRDPAAPVEARVEDLLSRMTLREKVMQMRLVRGLDTDPSAAERCRDGWGASHQPADKTSLEGLNAIQKYLLGKTRLGIPLLMVGEALHGLRYQGCTVFP